MEPTDHVHKHFKYYKGPIRPTILLNDGTSISVQASQYHYCEPRLDNMSSYTTVEVYHWPENERFFYDYGGSEDSPAGFVPVNVVNFYIEKRGGMLEKF